MEWIELGRPCEKCEGSGELPTGTCDVCEGDYRLGKLYASLRSFAKARRHIEIVEAVQEYPPLVGWRELGFAYLEARTFSDCEYYFGRIIREGERLATREGVPAEKVIGDRLDERGWPLALIRAWGHLGLAISYAERDGDLSLARAHVDAADALLEELGLDPVDAANDERFPTRAPAAALECRGLILLREGRPDEAIEPLGDAISRFPHSRAYFELGLALEQHGLTHPETRMADIARAQRLFRHGVSLSRAPETPPDVSDAMERVERLTGGLAPAAS